MGLTPKAVVAYGEFDTAKDIACNVNILLIMSGNKIHVPLGTKYATVNCVATARCVSYESVFYQYNVPNGTKKRINTYLL